MEMNFNTNYKDFLFEEYEICFETSINTKEIRISKIRDTVLLCTICYNGEMN